MEIGRNDPCPCGSGKKYKKCCLAADDQQRFAYGRVAAGRASFNDKFLGFAIKRDPDGERLNEIFAEETGLQFSDDALPLFQRWLSMRPEPGGGTTLDTFVAEVELDEIEAEVARGYAHPRCGFFRVERVLPKLGAALTDILAGDTVTVLDQSLSKTLKDGHIISAIIHKVRDMWIADCNAMSMGPGRGAGIIQVIVDSASDAKRDPEKESDYLNAHPFYFAELVERFVAEFSQLPKMFNMDNEPIIMCRAEYAVNDIARVRDFFAGREDFPDHNGDLGHWVRQSDDRILGSVRLGENRLRFETNSRERLERFTTMFAEGVGDAVTPKGSVVQDIEQMMAARDPRAPAPRKGSGLDPALEKQIVEDFLNQQYAKWPDEELPALGGQTPREAVKTAAGRRLVEALLDDFEASHAADNSPAAPRPDFDSLRKELGLVEAGFQGP